MVKFVQNGPRQCAAADSIHVGHVGRTPPICHPLPRRLQITLRSEALKGSDQTSTPVDNRAKGVENNGTHSAFRTTDPATRREASHVLPLRSQTQLVQNASDTVQNAGLTPRSLSAYSEP